MNDANPSLWAVLEARDATIASLRALIAEQQTALEARQVLIDEAEVALEARQRLIDEAGFELEARQRLIDEAELELEARQRLIDEAELALEARQRLIHEAKAAAAESLSRQRELARQVEDKEVELRMLHKAIDQFQAQRELAAAMAEIQAKMKTIEEKEDVIREQVRALRAYRGAFAVFGWLLRPLYFVGGRAKAIARGARKLAAPRLGVLYQHEPRRLSIPQHYREAMPPVRPPLISIVTPSYQQGDFIERTIQSVLEQGYPRLEYYVQDGGSTDDTVEILRRYADRLAGWESRPDSGQSQAINRGFARTRGDIMAWLNSDDILLPGALAYVADYFARHPEVDVVYGHRILITEDDLEIGRWLLPAHDNEVLSWADYVPQETLFWRRAIWERAGGSIDESFRFAMDWDLLVRFRDAGARMVCLPRFIGGFRIHAQQKTSAAINEIGFREMTRIRERALGFTPTGLDVRRAVAPYLLRHIAAEVAWQARARLGGAR